MDGWMIIPGNKMLSALVLFVIAMPFLYAARKPMHGLFISMVRAISGPLRLGSRWMFATAVELRQRNKTVLMAHGREEITQTIDREFERIGTLVKRELHGFPVVQRKLMDEITRIEEDYQKSGEVPPPPPEWAKAVSAIAKIRGGGDGLVEKILEDISKAMEKIYDKAISEYRRSYENRHKILKEFSPFWRSLNKEMENVGKNITSLQGSASSIDAQMDKYKQMVDKTDKAEQTLTSSAGIQFSIATLVLLVAAGGAFVNFFLIARPMSAMVGGGQHIAFGLEAADIAAMVILFMEAAMGLFLMESLRITHLFPRINNMNDHMRKRLMWVSFTILFTLAGIEVALAVMRDFIIAADIALRRELVGGAAAAVVKDAGWATKIPVAGQMILGFVLPFALAFLAIPLEYFIYSARTVLGVGLVIMFRSLGFLLRVLSIIMRHFGKALTMLYDVLIFPFLMVERFFKKEGDSAGKYGSGSVTAFSKRGRTGTTGEHIL
jgi:hypothetical protein